MPIPEQKPMVKGVGDADGPDLALLPTPGLGVESQVGVAPTGRGLRSGMGKTKSCPVPLVKQPQQRGRTEGAFLSLLTTPTTTHCLGSQCNLLKTQGNLNWKNLNIFLVQDPPKQMLESGCEMCT